MLGFQEFINAPELWLVHVKSDLAVLHFCKSFIRSLPLLNRVNLQSFGNGDDDQMILAMEHFLSASAGSGQVCLLLNTAHFRCHFFNQSIADPISAHNP
jgi:hypothetical protein